MFDDQTGVHRGHGPVTRKRPIVRIPDPSKRLEIHVRADPLSSETFGVKVEASPVRGDIHQMVDLSPADRAMA